MRILHTADLHLANYGDERWETLEKLVELGKKEKVEIFVISGDLFNKGVNAEELRTKLREIFSRIPFQVLIIPGNHDMDSYSPGMFFGQNVNILQNLDQPFVYKDILIWGMPFASIEGEEVLSNLRSIKKCIPSEKRNILLYHGELLDAFFSPRDFGEEREKSYMPVKLSYFKDLPFDYVLAGHFHRNFDFWELEDGGFFVYPGSPVSITKREIGRRRVNIFEVGKAPEGYFLDTPYYEEVTVELDPFIHKNPLKLVEESIERVPSSAKLILTIKGYMNSEKTGMNEEEFAKRIERIIENKNVEEYHPEFKDINLILTDELFKRFMEKLEETGYGEEKKKRLRHIAISAMIKADI
ncbi:metallophosphoesterase [Candidatus Calescamantes bacterium]|nr:metallophosphoesterase [Candidatus Calescamantes bacterium]